MKDDEWGIEVAPGDPAITHVVGFSDWIAHERDDLVARAAAFLAGIDGVTEAIHQDREVILVKAEGVSVAELSEAFAEWWNSARGSEPPWQEVLKRHASAAHSVLKPLGFRKRKNTFNRQSADDVWQVVEIRRLDDDNGRVDVGIFIDSIVEPLGYPPRHSDWISEVECHIRDPFGGRHHFEMAGSPDAVAQLISAEIAPGLERLRDRAQIREATADGTRKLGMHRPANPVVAALAVLDGDGAVAQTVMQRVFEEASRRSRPGVHARAANLGLRPLATGTDRTLTAQEETDLESWQSGQQDRLEGLQKLADGNRMPVRRLLRSPRNEIDLAAGRTAVPALWRWLLHWTPSADNILVGEPIDRRYVGYSFDELTIGQQLLAELLATFMFSVIAAELSNAAWVLDDDAAFAIHARRSEAVVSRAQQIINDIRDPDHRAHDPMAHSVLSRRIDWIVERIS